MGVAGLDIRFGTEGWRGVMGEDFTFANVRRVGFALVDYLQKSSLDMRSGPVVIGYDTRFLSSDYAKELAGILSASGLPVLLARKSVITPALSLATVHLKARLGIMVTASHNPPKYNGIKIKSPYGGPADEGTITGIEACLHCLPQGSPGWLPSEPSPGEIRHFDPDSIYLSAVRAQVNGEVNYPQGLKIIVDTMHGAGRGYLDRLLEEKGAQVIGVRREIDPGFGGTSPEPTEANLQPLKEAVKRYGADLGLATDGDGDRLGVVDNTGAYVDAHRVFLLLLTHLYENRMQRGSVVKTLSTSSLVDKAAESFGLQVREMPVGFKHIAAWCQREAVILGGEESGGYGFPQHLLDRDGVLAGLLLVEYIVQSGRSLGALLEELAKRFGPSVYQRVDLPVPPNIAQGWPNPPCRLGQRAITDVATLDGLKLKLGNDGWILFRASGTEPLLRVYAEAPSKAVLEETMEAGLQWINSADRGTSASLLWKGYGGE